MFKLGIFSILFTLIPSIILLAISYGIVLLGGLLGLQEAQQLLLGAFLLGATMVIALQLCVVSAGLFIMGALNQDRAR